MSMYEDYYEPMIGMEEELPDFGVDGVLVARTDKAILVKIEGADEWFPLSQVGQLEETEIGQPVDFFIPYWLAEKKGLV